MVHRQALASGAVVGEDYEIERVLGSGGFGITYLAKDRSLGIQVAIKEYFPSVLAYRDAGSTVSPSSDANQDSYTWGLERFLAEAQTLARLRHPNIVRVSRYFKDNGTAYMVLGFVVGNDLEDWLNAHKCRPTQKELDAIVGPLIDALEVVHKADVVHRDIKPANIYIQKSDGAPILLDFGAARQALGEQTRATAAFVSPGYSPPESHENDPVAQGPWTDIYGLAATLYRAVTGKAPAQVMSRLSRDTYVPLALEIDFPAEYRPGFLAAIDRGMALRREDRPKSVAEWRKMLFGDVSAQDTLVRRPDEATVVTPLASGAQASSSEADTVVRPPPAGGWSPNARRAAAAALALVGIAALYYIYASFDRPAGSPSGSELASQPPTTDPASNAPSSSGGADIVPYKNVRFGFELGYPAGVLVPDAPPANGGGQSFASPDGDFRVSAFASFNSDEATPDSLRSQLLSDDARYRNARITDKNDDGFSMIGTNDGRINGYVAIFTCANQLLNVLEVSFPSSGAKLQQHRNLATQIINTFRTGQGDDSPADCSASSPSPPAPAAEQQNYTVPQPTGLFADPSLRRLAVYGWSASGIQNGFWTAGINSNSGVLFEARCNDGPGNLRSGSIKLQNIPAVLKLSGNRQISAQIGDYSTSATFSFSPAEVGSTALLDIAETQDNGGQYLEFLRQLAAGETMTLRIPDADYQEDFNLFAADRALGPCLGQSIAQPWVDQGERDGVIGTGVRNGAGAAFYIRCDTTLQSRGNAVLAFAARQRPGVQNGQTATIKAFVGSQVFDLEFALAPEPNVLTGYIYNVAANNSTGSVGRFLEILSAGNQLRLLNQDIGVDETFSLSGSQRTLQGCADLY